MLNKIYNCYSCGCPLDNENSSTEHILLNACGGKLKSRRLLCKKCNSDLGNRYDSELASQLNHFSNILLIKRENGKPQPTEAINDKTGEIYSISSDGIPRLKKPQINKEKKGNIVQLSVKANTERELLKILNGFRRKYPNLDVEAILENAQKESLYIDEPLHSNISVGGPIANQSIAKSAIDFYLYKGHNIRYIEEIVKRLREGSANIYVEPINIEDCMYPTNETSVNHFIGLYGNVEESILYSYVEYFGIYGFIVKLNMQYNGPEIIDTYCFDVIEREEVCFKSNNCLNPKIIRDYSLSTSDPRLDILRRKVSRVLKIAFKRQNDNEIGRIVDKAWAESLGRYPNGTLMTPELTAELVNAITKNMMPYIVRNLPKE